jgi:hypothetical protein
MTKETAEMLFQTMRLHLGLKETDISLLRPVLEGLSASDVYLKVFEIKNYTELNKERINNIPAYVVTSLLYHFKGRAAIVAYFKRPQRDGIYHYYKVYGGPGKTRDGYQEVINFLNEKPMLFIEHNYTADNGLTGTWCTYEVGEPITEDEYQQAYERATGGDFTIM